ncbi:MAG: DUF1295 domain-containing protein [Bacteroidales bacterium]
MANKIYARSIEQGFLSEGLWGLVRHPNFVGEQGIWISFFFGVAASGDWLNWTGTGALLLILLFVGSTALTENISSSKYPGYALYRREVRRIFPKLSSTYNTVEPDAGVVQNSL